MTPLKKLRFVAFAGAASLFSLQAFAAVPGDTFVFQFTNGGATATGSVTFGLNYATTANFSGAINYGNPTGIGVADISVLSLTVSGAGSGNGTFSKANFTKIYFTSSAALNFTSELSAQGNLTDFNIQGAGSPSPTGNNIKQLTANWGSGATMTLSCLYLQGVGTCGSLGSSSTFVPISNPLSSGAATVLDSLGSGTGDMATAITRLNALTPTQRTAALNKLAPVTSRAITATTRDAMSSAMDRISARLDGLRVANGDFESPVLAATGGMTGMAAGDTPPVYGMWSKAFAVENSQGAKDGFAGYKGSGWGMAFGTDRDFGQGLTAGLAFTYSNTGVNYRDQLSGNGSSIASYQLAAYGSQEVGPGFVEGMVAYSKQKYNGQRDTAVNGFAYGNYDGDQWGVRIGGGLPYTVAANTTITPQARLEWNRVKQDSYVENGGGALALNVSGTTNDRLRASLGAQVNHDTEWSGTKLAPFARAFWNHDFKNDGIDSTASFVGGGAAFNTPGQKLDKNTYTVGLGVNVFTRRDFTATLSYDHDTGSGYRAHTAQAVARWKF